MTLVMPLGKAGKTVLNAERSESVLDVSKCYFSVKTAHTVGAHIVTSSRVCLDSFNFFF